MVRAFFVLVMSVSGFHFSSRSVIAGPTWQDDPEPSSEFCVGIGPNDRDVCRTNDFIGTAVHCQLPEYQKPCFALNADGSPSTREHEGKIAGFYAVEAGPRRK